MKLCSTKDCGNNSYCKELCRSHYNKQWRNKHKEESRRYNKSYRRSNKESVAAYDKKYSETDNGRFVKAKTKAKQRELEFDLYFEDFIDISSRPCFYGADELCGRDEFQGGHLDRINNSLGYTLDNVISCGLLCNRIRMNNLTVAETKDAVEAILVGRKKRQLINANRSV